MEKEYLTCIEQYKNKIVRLEDVRKAILQYVGTEYFVEAISIFTDAANEIQDVFGMAFSHAINFWLSSNSQLEYCHKENQIAKRMYQSQPNYEKADGYLTVLNNDLIYFNVIGDLKNAYLTVSEAFRIVNQERNMSYLVAFSTNYVYVLNELGLYEKAYDSLLENDQLHDYLTPAALVVTQKLKVAQLILLNKDIEALSEIEKSLHIQEEKQVFSPIIFNAEELMIAVKMEDKVKAEALCNELLENLKLYESSSRDVLRIYRSLGLYYMYLKDYQKALVYYEYIYQNISRFLGFKRIALMEIGELYEKIGEKEKAIEAKNKAILLLDNSLKIVADILASTDISYSNKFTNLAYKDLYTKTDTINGFLKNVSNKTEIDKIEEALNNVLSSIHKDNEHCMLLHNTYKNIYLFVNKGEIIQKESKNELMGLINVALKEIPLSYEHKIIGSLYISDAMVNALDISSPIASKLFEGLGNSIASAFLYQKVLYDSNHDQLTHLLNRAGFELSLKHVKKPRKASYYALSFDIDDFKKINDTYGHHAGDIVLQSIASMLRDSFKKEYVARVGGEEFSAIYFGNKEELTQTLDVLFKRVRNEKYLLDDSIVHVTISCGAVLSEDISNYHKANMIADSLLYEVKRNQKNNYKVNE